MYAAEIFVNGQHYRTIDASPFVVSILPPVVVISQSELLNHALDVVGTTGARGQVAIQDPLIG